MSSWANPQADSLVNILSQNLTKDTSRVNNLNELATVLYISKPDTAIELAEEALALSESLGFESGIGSSHYSKALALIIKGEYDASIAAFEISRKWFRKLGDSLAVARAYVMIGSNYIYKGDHENALKVHLEALEKSKAVDFKKGVAVVANNIGYIYHSMEQLDKALEGYQEASVILEEIGDNYTLSQTESNIGSILSEKGRGSEAKPHLLRSLELRAETGNRAGITDTYNALASLEEAAGDETKAWEYYSLALKEARSSGDKWFLARSHRRVGEFEGRRGNIMLAEAHLDSMLSLALESGARENELNAYETRYLFFEGIGRHKNALENFKNYIEVKDSIFGGEKLRQLTELQTQYETAKTESENQLLREENERQDMINIAITIGVIILLGMVGLLWRSVVQKNNVNTLLEAQRKRVQLQNERLEDLNQEKDQLMGIVAHDLKSPISKVQGLISLLETSGPLNAQQHKLLDMTGNVTESADRLIRDLVDISAMEQGSSQVMLETFDLQSFMKGHLDAFREIANRKNIAIHLKQEPEYLEIHSDPEFLQRILDNLISNAIKFSPRDRSIFVSSVKDGDQYVIRVKDEGPGMTEDDKVKLFKKFQRLSARPTAGESSTGLGLSIIKALATKLGGEITVVTAPGEGAEFTVRFPLKA